MAYILNVFSFLVFPRRCGIFLLSFSSAHSITNPIHHIVTMGLLCLASLLLVSTLTPSSSAKFFPGEDMSHLSQRPQQPLIFAEPFVAVKPPKALQTFSSNSSQSSHNYHVYSSRDFAGGRGISIVTTEERIKKFQDVTLAPGINDNSSPPFLEQDIPGKGRGIIATKLLHRGDRIFAHTPLLMIDADVFDEAEFEWSALEEEAVNNLPAESQKMFWELFGQPVLHPVSGRIDPNAFDLDMSEDEDSYYAVFPETAVRQTAPPPLLPLENSSCQVTKKKKILEANDG